MKKLFAILMLAALCVTVFSALAETTQERTDADGTVAAHAFLGEWNDERMAIVIKENVEGYEVTVTGSGGAFSGAYWVYTCYYDDETDSLISDGKVAKKVAYTYGEDGENYSEEVVYDDGVAMFRLNEGGKLLWYDKNENAGEGRMFELATMEETDEGFYMTPITDEIFERIQGKSFKGDCTLPREDLRYLHVLHVDLDGVEHEGEMIVNYHIAEDVLDILRQLYEAGYPIEKIRLVDEYDADDELSMEDNNSSSFNFRFISHTTRVSKHGLGLAVDINTLYNPYTKVVDDERIVEPVTGEPYLDRDADFPYIEFDMHAHNNDNSNS